MSLAPQRRRRHGGRPRNPDEPREVKAASMTDSSCTCEGTWQGQDPRPECYHEADHATECD